MRLTAKFLVAFVLALAVALGATTWLNLERERDLFERDLRHDSLLIGQLVAQAYEHALARGGATAAAAALTDARIAHTGYNVTRVPASAVPEEIAAEVTAGQPAAIRDDSAGPDGRIDTYFTMGSAGVLRVSGSLAAEHLYLRETKERMIFTSLAALLLAAIAASTLGVALIARPTRALVAKARRVGRGDFGEPLVLRQRDELGELATELNAMTEHLAGARDQIVQASEARVAAVEQVRHADRLATVGKLAAGIAHELGTPLNVIGGHARMIQSGEAIGEEVTDSARIIVEQSQRITAIVLQLLDFARRGSGEKAVTDLVPLAHNAVELLASTARKSSLTLAGPRGREPCTARVDAGQVMQVVTNLVVNAIHATPPHGRIDVDVRTTLATAPRPDATARRHVVIEVSDTGSGMDASTRERLFEPFFTTKGVGEGTGLGMAVVHGIVADHDGWVEVASTPGEGSRFSVYLPAA
ncbi:MAG: HAMP domain-containing histidine kinase [Deltaproteobacteria bacterium]|nr:HAMP domain-containing histidine kinase [Deltaproteobacteria bacterium]